MNMETEKIGLAIFVIGFTLVGAIAYITNSYPLYLVLAHFFVAAIAGYLLFNKP
ncbi:hypothetical protein SAMN04488691_11010 [Haloferax larsenii]|uniref:Uncharacterized protein n=1 Tax=Haloferax larsenii TaxID=302484 RepID=A0A1H7TQ56_HALLR|nr:hypothetical protein SAMN04488691_11010 [Haloferax larsenii]